MNLTSFAAKYDLLVNIHPLSGCKYILIDPINNYEASIEIFHVDDYRVSTVSSLVYWLQKIVENSQAELLNGGVRRAVKD